MENKVPSFLLEKPLPDLFRWRRGRLKVSFLEKGMQQLAHIITTGYLQPNTFVKDGLLQQIDARIKVLFLLFFVVIVSLKKALMPEMIIGTFVFLLTLTSRLNLVVFYKRVLFLGFLFGFLVALPSALNVITPGKVLFPMFHLSRPYRFWIYRVPQEIGLTAEGLHGVAMLTLRVMNSLALSFLVWTTSSFPEIIKGLKVLKVPDGFLLILSLSYQYIFLMARTMEDLHLAQKSRLVGQVSSAQGRSWVVGRIAFLFQKTRWRGDEIFKAMVGRGFSDRIKIYGIKKLNSRDWLAAGAFTAVGVLFLWM
jgi:energy-coupling factor transporter transmembrane protein EcfT